MGNPEKEMDAGMICCYPPQLAEPEDDAVPLPRGPKPGDSACEMSCVLLHSAGGVLNALHMACFTDSGERLTDIVLPFSTNVGDPLTPYICASCASTG